MLKVTYAGAEDTSAQELRQLYDRLHHDSGAAAEQLNRVLSSSTAFVTARIDGKLVGVARGVSDGARGYFTECKLDPEYQGPAAVTRRDGRIEHDSYGIATEMAHRVLQKLRTEGVQRIDVVAWGTEVDFLQDLGFKRRGGLVGMSLRESGAALAHNVGTATV